MNTTCAMAPNAGKPKSGSVKITVAKKSPQTENAAKPATAVHQPDPESPVSPKRPDKTIPKQGKIESRPDSTKTIDATPPKPKVNLEKGGPSEDRPNKGQGMRKSTGNSDDADPGHEVIKRHHRPRCDYCNRKGHKSSKCPSWYKGHGDTLYYCPPRQQDIDIPTSLLAEALINSEAVETEVGKNLEEFDPVMSCLESQNVMNGRINEVGTPPHKGVRTKIKGKQPTVVDHDYPLPHANPQTEKGLAQTEKEVGSLKRDYGKMQQEVEKLGIENKDLKTQLKNSFSAYGKKQQDFAERLAVLENQSQQKEPKVPRTKAVAPKNAAPDGTAPTNTKGKPHGKAGTSASLELLPLTGDSQHWASDSESPTPKELPVKKPEMALADYPEDLQAMLATEASIYDVSEEVKRGNTLYTGEGLGLRIDHLEDQEGICKKVLADLHLERLHIGTTAANGDKRAEARLPLIKQRHERAQRSLGIIQDKLEAYRKAYSAYQAEELEKEARCRAYAAQREADAKREADNHRRDLEQRLAAIQAELNLTKDRPMGPMNTSFEASIKPNNKIDMVKIPLPQTYSGDPHDDVDEVIFAYESYLSGSNIPRERWPIHAMHLLKGKALAAYVAFAAPLQKQGTSPTWDDFKTEVLRTSFITHDRQLEARSALLNITQNGTVTSYLQQFRTLIARAGDPPPCDRDLTIYYWRGLRQWVRDESKVDPQTGRFWESFEDLAKHTITISRQNDLTPGKTRMDKGKPWGNRRQTDPLKLKATKLKTKARPSIKNQQANKPGGGLYAGGRGRGEAPRSGFGKGGIGGRGGAGGHRGSHDGYKENKDPNRCLGKMPDGSTCDGGRTKEGKQFHAAGCPLAARNN